MFELAYKVKETYNNPNKILEEKELLCLHGE